MAGKADGRRGWLRGSSGMTEGSGRRRLHRSDPGPPQVGTSRVASRTTPTDPSSVAMASSRARRSWPRPTATPCPPDSSSTTANRADLLAEYPPVAGLGEAGQRHPTVGGQSDAGGDLHGQEHCDGEHPEPHADLPGHRRADLVRQTAPQDRQQQQAEQQLAAYPGHGRQDVEEAHEAPQGQHGPLRDALTGASGPRSQGARWASQCARPGAARIAGRPLMLPHRPQSHRSDRRRGAVVPASTTGAAGPDEAASGRRPS